MSSPDKVKAYSISDAVTDSSVQHVSSTSAQPASRAEAESIKSTVRFDAELNNRTETEKLKRASQRTRRLAYGAMFAALALIFSYVEVLIPIPIPVPGVKLGIANLVIIIALYRMDFKYAMTINIVRIVIAGLLFSGVFGMLYSLAGGVLSLIVMYLLKKTNLFSMIGVSMAGGVVHNLGQVIVAALVVSNSRLLSYFAILLWAGIISGILIGILATLIEKRLPKFVN